MTTDDEQLCARLEERAMWWRTCRDPNLLDEQASARIRALSARMEAAEKMAEALRDMDPFDAAMPAVVGEDVCERARAALTAWERK